MDDFSFILSLFNKLFQKVLYCCKTVAVCQRVWVSVKRDTVLGGVKGEQCLGWQMEGEERTGRSCRADGVVC